MSVTVTDALRLVMMLRANGSAQTNTEEAAYVLADEVVRLRARIMADALARPPPEPTRETVAEVRASFNFQGVNTRAVERMERVARAVCAEMLTKRDER